MMKIQWYPGHVAKARREIKSHLKEVDIVIEIIDARCILSSINFLSEEINNKKHLIVVNKVDLVDEKDLKKVDKDFISNAVGRDFDGEIIFIDSRNNNIKKIVDKKIDILCDEILEKNKTKGIKNVIFKAMVVGMPNVGKSTFINSYVKKKVNMVRNIPGVTKELKWTKISDKLLLLDTPGVTLKKFDDNMGVNLALIGSINDNIVEKQELAFEFINKCYKKYSKNFIDRYKLKNVDENSSAIFVMDEIARSRGFVKKNNIIDYERTSNLIINDFRDGSLGKINLEYDS